MLVFETVAFMVFFSFLFCTIIAFFYLFKHLFGVISHFYSNVTMSSTNSVSMFTYSGCKPINGGVVCQKVRLYLPAHQCDI